MRLKIRTKTNYSEISAVIFYAIAVVILICIGLAFSFNDKEYTITVTDKERIVDADGERITSRYLIFGEDEDGNVLVFQNTDEMIRGKWNSSTIQGSLKVGKTYTVVVVGYRIPFLSCYENIIAFEEKRG